jgi:hypothetical protein
MNPLFEILKRDSTGNFHWIEAANDMETAKTRLKQLSADSAEEVHCFPEHRSAGGR